MVMIADLMPGDTVADESTGHRFTLVAVHTPHPLYPQLALVVWRRVMIAKDQETANTLHPLGWLAGDWFHDALASHMVLPQHQKVLPLTYDDRQEALRVALLAGVGRDAL